ncbi:2-C-methyl-D-erythritol 4-phosphate cytidylyltransferase [Herbiconiux sp. KACC 21604]|uniref:2-C-methyl-D-erythritol 4-phosphate cytidylyltransferase n=1 Tax=unclassified Herbiconiux TaxID=2618217 RepID=UPI001491224B|nr:2-C-methyl-D-erythritol 4-phosphate cytidylyltransferase [Herbiconiux sp. SALV-R1]QJU52514.1 2-C-methyl-D-erythritol 2,4-cyclodiphosphate synthase [Herbiconiux sp. SALV-R1]WPO87390.1 2-C-methyl-D-erythritol 4-phosphate cytidylyltransferase [Herbiconiux sp. KACC 21604]
MSLERPTVAVIVVAAGSGTRLGRAEPKAFVPISGRTVLERSLDAVVALASSGEPVELVVVVPVALVSEAMERVSASAPGLTVSVVAGGETRQRSVAAGLAALGDGVDIVLVHDAARAFTPASVFERVIAEVRATGHGAIPGLPVTDTVKQVDDGRVGATVDRSRLTAVQTPQGFPRAQLVEAYALAAADMTDDAALVREAGHPVAVVPGDARSFKITTPDDLDRADDLLRRAAMTSIRTGVGVDAHAFDAEAELWLAGLHWPGEAGLAGHSDGDVVSHAICDALLGAAGLGDLGSRFGTDDPELAGAHGEVFLRRTLEVLTAAGYSVGNVSVQLIGNRPRFAPRKAEAEAVLGAVLRAPVSVSATTTDGLGYAGRGEGLTAIATALVTGGPSSAEHSP